MFKPLIREQNEQRKDNLYIKGDGRSKMDKATRIEANLEPIDRNGMWVFNEEEKDNPHMKELREQFSLFELSLPYPADGPDCIEGNFNIINEKIKELDPGVTIGYSEFKDSNPFSW